MRLERLLLLFLPLDRLLLLLHQIAIVKPQANARVLPQLLHVCGLQGLRASGLDRHAIQGDITAAGVLEHDRGHGAAFSQKKRLRALVSCVWPQTQMPSAYRADLG